MNNFFWEWWFLLAINKLECHGKVLSDHCMSDWDLVLFPEHCQKATFSQSGRVFWGKYRPWGRHRIKSGFSQLTNGVTLGKSLQLLPQCNYKKYWCQYCYLILIYIKCLKGNFKYKLNPDFISFLMFIMLMCNIFSDTLCKFLKIENKT